MTYWLLLLLSLVLPFILSLGLTALVRKLAPKIGAIDHPDQRKVHRVPIPRMGGVAIFLSFCLSLAILSFFINPLHILWGHALWKTTGALLALLLIVGIGAIDDRSPLKPGPKFLVQVISATVLYFVGFHIAVFTDPFDTDLIRLGWFDLPLTVLWIVAVTNAINLIDGLDGLASGVAVISAGTVLTISLMEGLMLESVIILIFIGSILGFLRFNFHPAKIFMGDSGSLFLGFSLAVFSIQGSAKVSTAFTMLVPVLILGLPLIDTTVAMTRRYLRWFLPSENARSMDSSLFEKFTSIFLPDRSHIHHKLLELGFSHRNTVLTLYGVSLFFGSLAVMLSINHDRSTILLLFILLILFLYSGFKVLKYREIDIFHNGIFLRFYNRYLLSKSKLWKIMDLLFIVGSFMLASYLVTPERDQTLYPSIMFSLPSLLTIFFLQYTVFWIGGLYRKSIQQLGLADGVRIVQIVIQSVLLSSLVIFVAILDHYPFNLFLLDFYLLLSGIIGSRITFHVLTDLFQRYRDEMKEKILIYGANFNGIILLHQLLSQKETWLEPIGFLDDNPNLEGKNVHGFPVFGGHWRLARLLTKLPVKQIILCTTPSPEIYKRIQMIARSKEVTIMELQIKINELILAGNDLSVDQHINKKEVRQLAPLTN